jgi:hypothetical protein
MAGNQTNPDSEQVIDKFEEWWEKQNYHPQGPIALWKEEFRKCFTEAQQCNT